VNVVFLNAVLAPLLILAAVPVILHLFAKSKPPSFRFSSIEFIVRILRSTMRVKRPQDWIILLVRTLLFITIIFLFLQPLFFSQRRLSGAFQKKNVVILVDATASMAYTEGAQTRFAAACAEASEILSGLSSKDTANIVWIDSTPEAVFPEMGVNFGYVQGALRRAGVTSEAGDIEEAVRLAVRMLEELEGKHEICIISDFQRTAWQNLNIDLPLGIDLIKVKVGGEEAANGGITDIYCNPAQPLVGEDVTIYCQVHNYSPSPVRRTVFLNAAGTRQSQDLMIPAWEKDTAIFKHAFNQPGALPITVSLNEDLFAGDDTRWALLEVDEFLRTAILAREPATATTWQRVLQAVGWATVDMLQEDDLAGEIPYDALMLAGWKDSHVSKILTAIRQGCTVVCFPAPDTSVSSITALADEPANGHTGVLGWEQIGQSHKIKIADNEDPVFKLFAGGEYGDPCRGIFRARLKIPAGLFPNGKVLIAYDDGLPALIRFPGNGMLYLWNLPLDPELSNWADQVEFLPFLAELLLTSRPRTAGERGAVENLPGEHVVWRLDRDVLAADMRLSDHDNAPMPIREHRAEAGVSFVSEQTAELGLYKWEYREKPMGYNVVNFPIIESDLRAMPLAEIQEPGAITVNEGRKVRHLRDGVSLWPYLLVLAAALALLEESLLVWVEKT
jgi:hypothetical protein